MIANIIDCGAGELFIATRCGVSKIEELGIVVETKEPTMDNTLYYRDEILYFFTITSNEDKNLIKLALGYEEQKLGDIYGRNILYG